MRQFLDGRRPSPAMAVAFVALLAALSGTAVALPGKNTVDGGDIKNGAVGTKDIKNGAVGTKDIKNNDVRSGDVRNNTLTGADINESSLGTVPSANSANTANTANSANSANTANTANRASSAGSVDRLGISSLVTANDGQVVTVLSQAGFRWELDCEQPVPGAQIQVVNVSAGNDAHFDDNLFGPQDDDFDQGETVEDYEVSGVNSIENSNYSILAPNGAVLHGDTAVLSQPAGLAAACAAAVTGLG